jgi:hypothetical protein
MHRFLALSLGLVLTLGLLAACGGGGSSGTPSSGSASLKGVVLTADGSTSALGGYAFRLRETGTRRVSDANGRFDLGRVPAGALTLIVDGLGQSAPSLQVQPLSSGDDDDANGDDGADDNDADDDNDNDDGEDHDADDDLEDDIGIDVTDDDVSIIAVRDGETVVVELRMRDGRIEGASCSRSRDDRREVESRLVRTTTSDDPDIKGEIELRARTDRQKFKVEVEQATPDRVLEVVVIDDSGNEESQGTRTVGAFGEAEWELATNDGARLPFGVGAVADLEGFLVEVRDAGSGLVLLRGDVPEVPAAAADGSGGSGEGERSRGRSELTAVVAGLEGHVEIRSRPDENREKFEMEAEHLAAGRSVRFLIEATLGGADFVSIGTRTADGEGEAELELATNDGATLPLGVSKAGDLSGRAVQVRDATTGDVLLTGIVPNAVAD